MPPFPIKSEDEIRDHLADHLDLVGPGLTLIDKERLLRNDKGAKGFLDIFARTADHKFLIIEVKRSNATAREAIQELVKYFALLKQNMLVKPSEVRLSIASTEWHELLVPFSEFARSTLFDCQGLRLILGSDGLTERTELIDIAPEDRPRRLSRRHFIWGFDSEKLAREGVPVIAKYMRTVGLRDFVILLLAIRNEPESRFLYFAQQELSLEAYMTLIRNRLSSQELTDFENWLKEHSDLEDKVGEAADKVWEDDEGKLYSRLRPSNSQIAYPEKARNWFAPQTLVSVEVFRFGRFEDEHITDEIIKAEIVGEDGSSFHHLNMSASVNSKAEIAALLAASDSLLDLNPVWRTAIRDLCTYASRSCAKSIRVRAFSNEDILRALAALSIGRQEFTPSLYVEILYPHRTDRVVGTIEWNGRRPNLDDIIKTYLNNDSFYYFMLRHFGEQRSINADIMAELGLSYGIGKIGRQTIYPARIRSLSIDEIAGGDHKFLTAFPAANSQFTEGLIELFLQHEHHFAIMYEQSAITFCEKKLEGAISDRDRSRSVYWSDDVGECQVCGRDLSQARFMIDSAVARRGPWACMCAMCASEADSRIEWGYGQLYERDAQGWRLVGGGNPEDDIDESH